MSHHFDTPTAREDPRLNLCDYYLFPGPAGKTVMALTVNPDAGGKAPDMFRDEGIYAFQFDLNCDDREEVTFKVLFGAVEHVDGSKHRHRQRFEVVRASGEDAVRGRTGELIAAGHTDEIVATLGDVNAFAGLAPDMFAADSAAFGLFREAFFKEDRFDVTVFGNNRNFFGGKNVTAIVLEVPSAMIGHGRVRSWATVSLHGHAPEVQVSRWGLPLITNIFMPDLAMREDFNRGTPLDDTSRFAVQIADVSEKMVLLAGSSPNPTEHARTLTARLMPAVLPYIIGSEAEFDRTIFNGRGLTHDVFDVMVSLAANLSITDGVTPDSGRVIDTFPYFGAPYPLS